MFVFLDETFRVDRATGVRFGALCGIGIPEDEFAAVQTDIRRLRRPYHGKVLKEDAEIKGSKLLTRTTFDVVDRKGFSDHLNLAVDLLNFAKYRKLPVFGVVCFEESLSSFVCGDADRLDNTFRFLFERIDLYMKRHLPGRYAKLVFDNRDHRTHKQNARAITNFFSRSHIGLSYDSIFRVTMFAVSEGHNYGLQLADLVTTVIGLKFQGEQRSDCLWQIMRRLIPIERVGIHKQSSLKVIKQKPVALGEPPATKGSAALPPMAEPKRASTEPEQLQSSLPEPISQEYKCGNPSRYRTDHE